jgi:hypothetical protein
MAAMKTGRIEPIMPISRIEPITRIAPKKRKQTRKNIQVMRDENLGRHIDIIIGGPLFTYNRAINLFL